MKCKRCNIPSHPGYFGWGPVVNGHSKFVGVCFRCNGSNIDPGLSFNPATIHESLKHGEADYQESEVDDSVNFCPNCERPQQFSGACSSCESDPDYQHYLEARHAVK